MRAPLAFAGLIASVVASPALAIGAPAAAALEVSASQLSANDWDWRDDAASKGALAIVVSIADQRAYVYRGKTLVAVSSVSTGKDGKNTPVGSFTVLQKEAVHHSNKYDDAPMPFMQRLTWDGVAIHAGANPGFPASHGCIRVPAAFAKKLFGETRLGTTVNVVDESVVATDPAYTPEALAEKAREETAKANEEQIAAIPAQTTDASVDY